LSEQRPAEFKWIPAGYADCGLRDFDAAAGGVADQSCIKIAREASCRRAIVGRRSRPHPRSRVKARMRAPPVIEQGLRTPTGSLAGKFYIASSVVRRESSSRRPLIRRTGLYSNARLTARMPSVARDPAWMFDHGACAATYDFQPLPSSVWKRQSVVYAARSVLKTTSGSSNTQLSGASGISHDQNRGEHGTEVHGGGDRESAQAAPAPQQMDLFAARITAAHQIGRPAGGGARSVGQLDDAADPGACGATATPTTKLEADHDQ